MKNHKKDSSPRKKGTGCCASVEGRDVKSLSQVKRILVPAGRGVIDESYLTGEPFEITKTSGSTVISGAINGESALTIRTT